MPDFPSIPFSPPSIPAGLDPMAVGKSFFEEAPEIPVAPAIEGYSEFTFLARGGFGTVWSAQSGAHGIPVALKIPHVTDADVAERLELEAETLRSLDHSNIVRLLDFTLTDHGLPVLVMELVEGPTLTQSLPARGFDFDHALQIFLPVLEAVAHAHSRGIIHRDLKPSNILLSSDGTPKVSDFGLAQPLKDQAVAFSLTKSGIIAGTVEYLAPERYEPGHKPDPAADIFALGVILYEMISGRPPRGSWQPLSQLKRLDVRLDELITEAIHPDPAKRLPSAEHFAKRLTEIRDSRPRYAGTPLFTKPVRYADFIWTIAGLYCLTSSFCTLEAIHNTDVPAIFDLRFGHTHMLGGFWALWLLTILMGIVWSWQAARLWRFRHIPLREALPSPFAIRMGASTGAAVGATLAQLLCAWAPLAFMGWIYADVWYWATPETAAWERVLAVTRWDNDLPVSPWTWDLEGMFTGDEYKIREMRPGYVDTTWHLLDRQSFFVFTQPLLMALGAAGIAIGILSLTWTVLRQWRSRKPVLLLLYPGFCFGEWHYVDHTVRDERASRARLHANPAGMTAWRANEWQQRQALPLIKRCFAAAYGSGGWDPGIPESLLAPLISTGTGGSLKRDEFLIWLRKKRHDELLSVASIGSSF